MHKKGTEPVIWIIIEAVAITVAIIIIFNYINTVQDDTLFMKKFLARDLALMVNTVSTVPGEVTYTHRDSKADLSKFTYTFSKSTDKSANMVKVAVREDRTTGSVIETTDYPFYYDAKLSADFRPITDSKQIAFTKSGSALTVAKELAVLSGSVCPALETRGQLTLLILDAADTASFDVASQVESALKAIGNIMPTNTGKPPQNEEDRLKTIAEDTPVVISISTTKSGSITIFYGQKNVEKSQKLACLINKNLEARAAASGTVMPSQDKMVSKNTQGIGIRVEFGITVDTAKAAQAIVSGVREYNG